jgi:hypothetical protein
VRLSKPEAEPYRIQGARCIRETAKAIQVDIDGDLKWIPKSCVHEDSEVYAKDHEGELIVAGWFAEKEGLEP